MKYEKRKMMMMMMISVDIYDLTIEERIRECIPSVISS